MFVCKVSGYGFECRCSRLNFYFKCDCASNFWQQVELASVIESDLGDDKEFHKKWLVDFYAGETLHVSFDFNFNYGVIDLKMHVSLLGEKTYFKIIKDCLFLHKVGWGSYIVSIATKLDSKKIGDFVGFMKFPSFDVDLITSLLIYHALLHATLIC